MDYIVLDMEWNQPWPGSPSARKQLPVAIRGEIIQIGAVRVTEEQFVTDEFQIMIKPKYYRHLNRRVSKLTGIKESRLKEEGVPFPEAMEQFREWCGEDIVFLTWGFDDIGILRENLRLFQLDESFTEKWYNAQMIFNAQTDGSTSQKALKTAMEMFSIEATRPAHDALGDAYHTALICAMLDLKRGMDEYDAALKSHENGFHGAEIPGCIARKVFYDYADKRAALSAMAMGFIKIRHKFSISLEKALAEASAFLISVYQAAFFFTITITTKLIVLIVYILLNINSFGSTLLSDRSIQ